MGANFVGASRTANHGSSISRPAVLGLGKVLFLALYQVCQVAAAPLSEFVGFTKVEDNDLPKDIEDPSLWLYLAIAAVLVLSGGAFAGLTIA